MGRTIHVRDGDRPELERLVRSRNTEQRFADRAGIVLASAGGLKNADICATVGVSRPTAIRWLGQYAELGAAGGSVGLRIAVTSVETHTLAYSPVPRSTTQRFSAASM